MAWSPPALKRRSWLVEQAGDYATNRFHHLRDATYAKRLELPRARFVWPQAGSGTVTLTHAQVSMLTEGIDWRMPAWTARPEVAV